MLFIDLIKSAKSEWFNSNLFYFTLLYFILFDFNDYHLFDLMWCSVMWCDVIDQSMMWCSVMWWDVLWCDLMWCDVIDQSMMWFDVIDQSVMWCSVLSVEHFIFVSIELKSAHHFSSFFLVGKEEENHISPLDKIPKYLRSRLVFIEQKLAEKLGREDERYIVIS